MKLAVIICNYNGKNYVVRCIDSLLKQTYDSFDLYLIDNASTDGTCAEVEKRFGNRVRIHQNSENLGGTGGFNTGLRLCIEKDYSHILMLDNDVVLARDAVENLVRTMEQEPKIGILGAKIMIMGAPEHIQEYGSYINRDKLDTHLGNYRRFDRGLPAKVYCDYVPACVALVSREAVMAAGVMPEDTFIYWDDIEFCHRIRQCGYLVAACGNAVAWHRGGFNRKSTDTFRIYYYNRNRLNYFLRTCAPEAREELSGKLVKDMFQMIYGSDYKGMTSAVKSQIHALTDCFMGVRGRRENRIFPFNTVQNTIAEKLTGTVVIRPRDIADKMESAILPGIVNEVIGKLKNAGATAEFVISVEKTSFTVEEYRELLEQEMERREIPVILEKVTSDLKYTFLLEYYEHITKVEEFVPESLYVDRYLNFIACEQDYACFSAFEEREKVFEDWFLKQVKDHNVSYRATERKIRELLGKTKFYIYGAGVFAFQTMLAIKEKTGLSPEAFITSVKTSEGDSIDGIPVLPLSELPRYQLEATFLVATPEIYHEEIKKTLLSRGVTEIHCLSMAEENRLMGEYLKKVYHLKTVPGETCSSKGEGVSGYGQCTAKTESVSGGVCTFEKERALPVSVYMVCSAKDRPLDRAHFPADYVKPVWAGGRKGSGDFILYDDTGESISHKNPDYCELTVTYWAWKNRTDAYKGICHYRRIFDVSQADLLAALEDGADMIVPFPYVCWPNAAGQILRYVSREDFASLRKALQETCPGYVPDFQKMCENSLFYNYNMLLARREIFDDYAEFLFRVLDRAEAYCIKSGEFRNDRYAGYLGEILTSLYLFIHREDKQIVHAPWRWLV